MVWNSHSFNFFPFLIFDFKIHQQLLVINILERYVNKVLLHLSIQEDFFFKFILTQRNLASKKILCSVSWTKKIESRCNTFVEYSWIFIKKQIKYVQMPLGSYGQKHIKGIKLSKQIFLSSPLHNSTRWLN